MIKYFGIILKIIKKPSLISILLRSTYYRVFLKNKSIIVSGPIKIYGSYKNFIVKGENCTINAYCVFAATDSSKIIISDNVTISPSSVIVPQGLDTNSLSIGNRKHVFYGDVFLDDNVWIGSNCTILGNLVIGKNSIVAAGSVVSHDVPPNCIVAGSPAKLIKHL